MRYIITLLLLLSVTASAKSPLDKLGPNDTLAVKAKVLQTFITTIEEQQEIISSLQYEQHKLKQEMIKQKSKCGI